MRSHSTRLVRHSCIFSQLRLTRSHSSLAVLSTIYTGFLWFHLCYSRRRPAREAQGVPNWRGRIPLRRDCWGRRMERRAAYKGPTGVHHYYFPLNQAFTSVRQERISALARDLPKQPRAISPTKTREPVSPGAVPLPARQYRVVRHDADASTDARGSWVSARCALD